MCVSIYLKKIEILYTSGRSIAFIDNVSTVISPNSLLTFPAEMCVATDCIWCTKIW